MPDDTSPVFTETLPEDLRSNPAFSGMDSVEKLARKHVELTGRLSSGTYDDIPQELRNDPNITKYKTVGELAKGHLESIKLIGKKDVIVPSENDPPEVWDKFYSKIGRPEKAQGYTLKIPDGLHPMIKVTPEGEGQWREAAHKIGLTNAQMNALIGWHLTTVSNALKQKDESNGRELAQTQKGMRDEWGPDYPQNITLAQRVVKMFGGDEGIKALGDLGNNPSLLRMMVNIGKRMSEDSVERGEFNELLGSAQEARKQLEDVNKKIFAMSGNESDYHDMLKRRTELYKIAYPQEAA
jgi:hypothetical protein